MKNLILLVLAVAPFLACAHLQESDDVDPIVRGSWVGKGRFYDRDLKAKYGDFTIAIEIHADNSVGGRVGRAILANGVVKSRPSDYLIEAELIGQVFDAGSLPGKDTVVLILMPPGDTNAEGDFHLKTNLTFDFTMRAGALELSRAS